MNTRHVLIFYVLLNWAFSPIMSSAQRVIEGTYDQKYKKFIPHVNLLENGLNPMYEVETLVHGYGVIENKAKLKGVIDSTGKLVVPMDYEKLESCSYQPGLFIFKRANKLGIIGYNTSEQGVIADKGFTKVTNEINQSKITNLFYVFENEKLGLFDISKRSLLIPTIYDKANFLNEIIEKSRRKNSWMFLNDSIAIAKKSDSLFIYDLLSGKRSSPFSDVVILSTGQFFLKTFDDFGAVSNQFLQPINTLNFRVLDCYNDHLLGRNTMGYGVTTASGMVVIPFIYEDIFFLNKNTIWLKKNGLWALSDYNHTLLSEFEFADIERSNEWFIHQLIEITRLDTTGGNIYIEREYAGINDSPTEIKKLIYLAHSLIGTKRLYNTYFDYMRCTNRGVAKRADGWHFIYPPLGQVEPEAWADVRYVPDSADPYGMMAYCKDGKWGVEKNEVKYQYVMYDSMELTLNCHNGCIIKNGYIYSYTTNYSINNKGNCYWEKNMNWNEYIVR